MRRIFTFLLFLLLPPMALQAQVAIDATNFPDDNFRTYVATFDTDGDNSLSETEIAAAKKIDVNNKGITDLTGLKYFTEAETLFCYNNSELSTLIVSENKKLTELQCYDCGLTSLDVSQNTLLLRLQCQNNNLSTLDVSNLLSLKLLYCYGNDEISSLDISQNKDLTNLDCHNCSITSLNVSELSRLSSLTCYKNALTTLDVSQNLKLRYLYCNNNNISSLILPTDKNNTASDNEMYIYDNPLGSINLEHCPNLKTLDCKNCKLSELNVANNTNLQRLICSNNNISKLDVTNNLALTQLTCSGNQLTTLDLTQNTKCNSLSIFGQKKVVDAIVFDFESIAVEVLPSSSSSTLTKDLFLNVKGPIGVNDTEKDYKVVDGKHYLVIGQPKADVDLNLDNQKVAYNFNPMSSKKPSARLNVSLTTYPYIMYINPASQDLSGGFYSGTIYLDYDAVVPEGMEVYVANEVKTADDGSQCLNMKSVGLPGDVIPANTPLYVRAADNAGLYAFARNLGGATPVTIPSGNLLQGTLSNKTVSPNAYLTLGREETSGEVGFWPFLGNKINAHRCFVDASLVDDGNAANGFAFSFGGDTNQLDTVTVSRGDSTEETWFSLQGVQLTEKPSQKGIYICNGKKIIIK